MIVLLNCSINSLADNNSILSSTGGVTEDSILISYNDLRKVNAKLIELEYEKDINKNLRNIVYNDSIAISSLTFRINSMDNDCKRRLNKIKRERNVAGGIGIGAIILLILSLL